MFIDNITIQNAAFITIEYNHAEIINNSSKN